MERERDIDENAELLVELLYGERDAESADLDEQTRSDLESLGELRALFRAMPDEEPPNAVTAKLMAAAAQHARSAPAAKQDESRGFFRWLADVFKPIMMHPGLAAAASLVLVAGVAGTLYVTGRADIAQPSSSRGVSVEAKSTRDRPPKLDNTGAHQAPEPADSEALDVAGAGPAVAESAELERDLEQKPAERQLAKKRKRATRPSPPPKSRVRATRIEGVVGGDVIPAKPEPKQEARRRSKGAGSSSTVPSADPSPPPALAADADDSFGDAPSGEESEAAREPSSPDRAASKKKKKESASTRQAKKLHGSAAAAAARGDCKKALSYGNKIRKIDSRYYDDVFLSDNRIRKCRTARKKK